MNRFKKVISLLVITIVAVISLTNISYGYGAAEQGDSTYSSGDTPYAPGQQEQTGGDTGSSIGDIVGGVGDIAQGQTGATSTTTRHTIGEIISEARDFISNAEKTTLDTNALPTASATLFNILFNLGVGITVIVGIYLGIKFMFASAEDKAKVKESLIPYIAGCIVIYGSFAIWKLTVLLLGALL